VVFGANTIFVAVAALPVAATLRHRPRRPLLVGGTTFLALSCVVLLASVPVEPVAVALGVAVTAVVLMGFGEVLLAPSLGPLANDLAPPGSRGLYTSVDAFVLSTGTIVGPALTGLILTTSTPTALLAVLAVGCLIAVGAATRVNPGATDPHGPAPDPSPDRA
jgi:MFS family permease